MITRFTYLFIALTSLTFLNQTRFKKEDLLGQGKLNFYDESIRLRPEAGKAFVAMREAALEEGIEIEIVSAYRSYERQKFIWNRKFYSNAEKGISPKENINKIIEYSTLPGTSRHHWGTDIDIIDGKKPKEGDLLLEEKFHENGPYVKLREWMEKMQTDTVFTFLTRTVQKEKDLIMSLGTIVLLRYQYQCLKSI